MVRTLRVGLLGLLALLKCTSATKVDPPEPERKYPDSCVADDKVYRTGHSFRIGDANYLVMCDRGNTGFEIATHKITRGGFEACVDHCERREDCDGFLFDGGRQAGICYLKGNIGSYTKTDGFVTCSKDPDGNGEKPLPLDGTPAGTAEGPVTRKTPSTSSSARATYSPSTSAPPRSSPKSSSGPPPPVRTTSSSAASSSKLPPWSPIPSSSSTSSGPAPPRSSPSSSSTTSSSKLPPWSPLPSSTTSSSDVPPRYSPSSTFTTSTYASSAIPSTSSDPAPPPAPTSKTSDSQTFTSTPTPSPKSQCQQAVNAYGEIYRGGNGSAYQFTCGIDHYGGDLPNVGSDTFLGCVDACDQIPDCIGYAYTTGNCWLKKYLKPSQINPNVDFALNLERLRNAKPEPPTTSVSVPTTAPTPAAGSCPILAAGNATSAIVNTNGMRYNIECGTDHNGGDLIRADGRNFLECSIICDATDKCIGFAWVGGNGPGNCYLKSTVTNSGSDPSVDYAYKDAPTKLPPTSISSLSVTDRLSTSLTMPVSTSSKAPEPTYPTRSTSTESKIPVPLSSTVSTPKISTSSLRTETDYVSKTYTQTQWVGSTTNGGSKTTSKPTTPVATGTARPEASKRPGNPPRPGDKDLCKSISSQKAKKLRVEATDGDRRYHGMYLKDPPNDRFDSLASLVGSWEDAASMFIHPNTRSLMAWNYGDDDDDRKDDKMDDKKDDKKHGKKNDKKDDKKDDDKKDYDRKDEKDDDEDDKCNLYGLNMNDGHPRGSWGECIFSSNVGTSGMVQRGDEIVWDHQRFGSWMICDPGNSGSARKYELKYWDRQSTDRPHKECSSVELKLWG